MRVGVWECVRVCACAHVRVCVCACAVSIIVDFSLISKDMLYLTSARSSRCQIDTALCALITSGRIFVFTFSNCSTIINIISIIIVVVVAGFFPKKSYVFALL